MAQLEGGSFHNFLKWMLNLHQISCKFVQKGTKKAAFIPHCRNLVQIRYHKGAGTKFHKCLFGE